MTGIDNEADAQVFSTVAELLNTHADDADDAGICGNETGPQPRYSPQNFACLSTLFAVCSSTVAQKANRRGAASLWKQTQMRRSRPRHVCRKAG
jgi:hypothetical protein